MPRSGFGGAVTSPPLACRRSMTPFLLEASANAPCTRTTVGAVESVISSPFEGRTVALVVSPAEEGQQQEKDVEDVEEDRRGEEWRGSDVLRLPQPLKVERGQAREDHEPEDRVDQRAVRDLDEDQHDPEHDQGDQGPEAGASDPRQVAPRRIAKCPEAGDEE